MVPLEGRHECHTGAVIRAMWPFASLLQDVGGG